MLVWCLRNNYTFVALKLAWGEARGRECIRSDTRPTEQRSPRPNSEQPSGRQSFFALTSLLAPHRPLTGMLGASAEAPRALSARKIPCRACIDNSLSQY